MRYALSVLVIGSLLLVWLLLCGPAPGGTPAAHAASLASVEATSCPAPERVVRLALRQHRAAGRAYDEWQRARRCLSLDSGRLRVERRPDRDATAAMWLAAMERWQRQQRDFGRRLEKLRERMTHPGGSSSGVRWLPLARWVGWPSYALRNLAWLMMNESSGRPRAVSPTNDHGLVQFNAPSWARTWARVMRCAFFPGVYDPELNLRFALYVFRLQGDSFLPAWRGDPAAQW